MRVNVMLYLFVGLLLVSGPAFAQEGVVYSAGPRGDFTGPRPHPRGTPNPVTRNLFPPDLIMRHQKAIGLTGEQKASMRAEILRTQTRFTELQWELQDAVESLGLLLKQDTVDEQGVLAQLDEVLAAEREVKRNQIQLMVRIKNKLTPEQQAQLREIRDQDVHAVPGMPLVPGAQYEFVPGRRFKRTGKPE